jgi:hypothetical protein
LFFFEIAVGEEAPSAAEEDVKTHIAAPPPPSLRGLASVERERDDDERDRKRYSLPLQFSASAFTRRRKSKKRLFPK